MVKPFVAILFGVFIGTMVYGTFANISISTGTDWEYDKDDEACVDCRSHTSHIYVNCRIASIEPTVKQLKAPCCTAYGTEYDSEDEICQECGKKNPSVWFRCRQKTLELDDYEE